MRRNITEDNLLKFLQEILAVEGEISLQDFIKRIPEAFELSDEDLKKSSTRPNECVYEQRCRNLVSHKNFPNNLISYENCIFRSR